MEVIKIKPNILDDANTSYSRMELLKIMRERISSVGTEPININYRDFLGNKFKVPFSTGNIKKR